MLVRLGFLGEHSSSNHLVETLLTHRIFSKLQLLRGDLMILS